MAVNWRERAILLGDCKRGIGAVKREVIRELVGGKSPKVLQDVPDAGEGWTVYCEQVV